MNAKIIQNKPYCPICGCPLGKMTGEYRMVTCNGKNYIEFERYCDGGCHDRYTYQIIIDLDGTVRYALDNVVGLKVD